MSGYMKQRMAMQKFGMPLKGMSKWTKEQRDGLYIALVDTGFYWDTGIKRWVHLERLSLHIRDNYGLEAQTEFRNILIEGGVLDRLGKRTSKINLPRKNAEMIDGICTPQKTSIVARQGYS